jgi:hypothetical protein
MARRFPNRTRDDWAKIASRRIVNVLRRHKLCNVRQLEAKISEAGPPAIRAQPLSIKDGLAYLLERGAIKIALPKAYAPGVSIDFYALQEFSQDRYTDKGRFDFILEYWPKYREACEANEYCGDLFERLVDKAIALCPDFIRLGEPGKDFKNYYLDGRRFDNSPPIDHVVYYRERGIVLGVEDKNLRQWIYPNDKLIPKFLRKCVQNQQVPVLVARKLPYLTRLFCQHAGVLGFETHFQYLHPDLEPEFDLIRHKDGIGFADLRFSLEPPDHLIRFFGTIVPKEIMNTAKTFEANRDLVRAFVDGDTTYREFMRELGILKDTEPDAEELADYYDER